MHIPLDAKSKYIDDAIVTAISFNQVDLLHELIKPVREGGFGLQFNLRTHNRRKHPVMRAIHDGNEIMLRELVKPCEEGGFGLSLDDVRDELNYQPAMQAALAGHLDLFAEIIKPVAEGGFGKPYSIDSELLNFPYNTHQYSDLYPYVMTIQHSRIAAGNHETLTVMDMQNRTTEAYKLGKRVGAGTYGSVYEFVFNNKKFAVKVPRDGWNPCSKKDLSEEYKYDGQEFMMMCKANPNDGPYALQSLRKMVDGKYFASSRMIMPLIPGVHITAALQVTKNPVLAAKIILQAALALQEVHMNGVLHSDIRPGNILVDVRDDGVVNARIIDYGFACLIGNFAPVLVPDLYKFFPPERIGVQAVAHTSQDVWSLARTVQWSLTSPLLRILEEFPAVAEFVEGGLQNDPEMRPTLASFIQNLQTQMKEYESKASKIHEASQFNKRHRYVTGNRFFVEDKMRKNTQADSHELVVTVKRRR